MTNYHRVVPDVEVQTRRHYGATSSGGSTTRFYRNYTNRLLYITDLAGFRWALRPDPAPSKELDNKLVIEDRYNLSEAAFDSFIETGMRRDKNHIGEDGKDPVTTFCNAPRGRPGQLNNLRVVEYFVDGSEFNFDQVTVLENLGLSVECQNRDPNPHPDNSFVVASGGFTLDEDEERGEVSFYQKVKLIDPLSKIGDTFINVRGKAEIIRPIPYRGGNLPEGIHLSSGSIDKNGKLIHHRNVHIKLEDVNEENGFYRSVRDALDSASVDLEKKRLEREALEVKSEQLSVEASIKQMEYEQRRYEQREKQRDRVLSTFERFSDRIEQLASQDKHKDRLSNNLKFIADIGKNLATLLVAVGGIAKFFATLKAEPS